MANDSRFPMTLSSKHHFVEFDGLEKRIEEAISSKDKSELRNSFTDPPTDLFLVRGPTYLQEGKGEKNVLSLKVPSLESPYELIGVNMFATPKRMKHVAMEIADERRFFESKPADHPNAILPSYLLVNWLMSPLFGFGNNHIVQHIFRLRSEFNPASDPALASAFKRFRLGSALERNTQLKYMFRVVDAPSTVKSAVSFMGGERPVLIGKALTTHYNEGKNYMEINMDVSSSKIASAINGTILKNVETIVMDCSWLLEGQRQEELPERVLCKIRWIWNSADEVKVTLDAAGERVDKRYI